MTGAGSFFRSLLYQRSIAAISVFMFAATIPILPSGAQNAPASGSREMIPIIVRWEGNINPNGVNGPDGGPFARDGAMFVGMLPRPKNGVRLQDSEITFDNQEYPLRVRTYPHSEKVQVTVALDHPKSCADVYLKRLEQPTLTQTTSIKAAFTVGYMIDGRSGENSCETWPLRAAKARFERYQNAMERSAYLVIPEAVKDALRAAATTDSDRRKVAQLLAQGDFSERQRLAGSLQNDVLAKVKSGDVDAAFASSSLLLETSKQFDYSSAVASQITLDALAKQTSDLSERASAASSSVEAAPPEFP